MSREGGPSHRRIGQHKRNRKIIKILSPLRVSGRDLLSQILLSTRCGVGDVVASCDVLLQRVMVERLASSAPTADTVAILSMWWTDSVGPYMHPERDASEIWAVFFMVYQMTGYFFLSNIAIGVICDNFYQNKAAAEAEDNPELSRLSVIQRRWCECQRVFFSTKNFFVLTRLEGLPEWRRKLFFFSNSRKVEVRQVWRRWGAGRTGEVISRISTSRICPNSTSAVWTSLCPRGTCFAFGIYFIGQSGRGPPAALVHSLEQQAPYRASWNANLTQILHEESAE